MTAIFVQSVGLAAPGLLGWQESVAILQGNQIYQAQPLPVFSPSLLPANERRRTTQTIKLALQAAQEALEQSEITADQVCSVFASSGGDYEIIDKLCNALTLPERPISPTHFHNSVHNAPAGYWTIATGCQQTSTSLSAYDGSFSAGLLEAVSLVQSEGVPVLLVAYDHLPPFPLSEARQLDAPFAVALLLNSRPSPQGFAELKLHLATQSQSQEARFAEPELEHLRTGNPAARSLPLLRAIARKASNSNSVELNLPYLEGQQLIVNISSCQ